MLIKRMFLLLLVLSMCGSALAADTSDLQVNSTKSGAKVNIDRVIADGKVVVSVVDAGEKPVFGLGANDFSVTQAGRNADITKVQPLEESMDVPRHIVLVLDNSYSMKERKAIGALLKGVHELLKIVRPIDPVQIVAFENFNKVRLGGYELGVQIFESSDPAKLEQFAVKAYGDNSITGSTVLNDAMIAGLQLIGNAPDTEPRFMVVFSDGEDLNSTNSRDEVMKVAGGLKGFNAYAIDYMPGQTTNKFLAEFTGKHQGRTWKAKSENDLVPIFQEVASKMLYFYVISYQFPPTGTLTVSPLALNIDEMRVSDGEPVAVMDASALSLRPVVDTVYGIAKWKVTVSNSRGKVTGVEGTGGPAQTLVVQVPTSDLSALASGGDLAVRMELQDKRGQSLALDAPHVKIEVLKTRAAVAVSPAALKFDEISVSGSVPEVSAEASALTVTPVVESPHGIAGWKAAVSNSKGRVAELAGEGAPAPELKFELPAGDTQALAAGGDLSVRMELRDRKGHRIAMDAPPVKVELVRTSAVLAVVPESVTIEEIRTIDASPMLSHIYFDKSSSDIPVKYVRLNGPSETGGFDEQKFRDAMEKYYQVLNIIGKRLTDKPEATITLVGCNDNTGEERGNKKLSTKRAEAVRDYLQTVWHIAPGRMTIDARSLPAMPSASRLLEGQAENRRVEVRSEESAILAPIQSTYFTNRINTPALTLKPDVVSPHGISSWKATASNKSGDLAAVSGQGQPGSDINMQLDSKDLAAMAVGGDIAARMELLDKKGHNMTVAALPVKVDFIQTSQRLAKKEGLRVQEKYALILFDFDKSDIDARNQDIVNRIVERAKGLPEATVAIVGHTDNIGKEKYNIKLSDQRAAAVYKLIKAAYNEDPGDRVSHVGVGPNNPLYDNSTPEARSFNRTVTITLEYMSAE